MSNAKRFLSVILAIIMICSTLVIGANAAYVAYKDEAIINQYDDLDKPVLTTAQYASAAMDEVDRMLTKEQLKFTREDIIVGDVDLTSLDAAMDSIYTLVNGALFSSLKGMLGDLQNLNVDAFKPESAGGVRRGTAGKTDTDIVYAVLQFLHDNTALLVSFVNGTIDLGSILPSLVDISEFANINKLLKGMLYEFAYDVEDPTDAQVNASTVDGMAQDLIDKYVVTGYYDDGEFVEPLVPALEGKTDISTGTMYNFIDTALKVLYNELVIPLGNEDLKEIIGEFCGVVYTYDEVTGEIIGEDRSNLNYYADFFNLDYEVQPFTFTEGATLMSDVNNLVKSIFDAIINPAVFTWQAGDTSMVMTNLTNFAKAVLKNTGGDFFADYVEIATPEEIDAMDTEEVIIYLIRAIANSSAWGMYFPDTNTIREFAFEAIRQLFATDAPELDFSGLDKNSTDSLVIMGINYAIYATKDIIDLGLDYVSDMDGVDAQLKKAVNYAIDNYGGLLSGFTFDENASGWDNLNKLIFTIIPANWLPTQTGGDVKTFIYLVVNAIADLDIDTLFDLFIYRADSELQSTPKQVIISFVARVVNLIFPGAFNVSATSLDALVTNAALAGTVKAIFDTLWNYRVELVAAILPTLCSILDLTNEQEFEFPELNWDPTDANVDGNTISTAGSLSIKLMVRNGSTGINTGYTDKDGVFHQDQLYTYDIKSVTTNLSGITVTHADTIAGGQTDEMRFTGSIAASTPFIVTITYDVLTEDGSPLTDAPITETMYSYIAKNEATDATTALTSTASGGFSITDGPKYLYAAGFGDLTDYTLTVQNTNATQYDNLLPTSTALTVTESAANKRLTTEDGTAYIQLVTDPVSVIPQVDDNPGIANVQVFETNDAYRELTGEERDAAWESMIAHTSRTNPSTGAILQNPKLSYTMGVTIGSTTVKNTATIFLYKDYGLPGLLDDEMGKHRQASAYAEAESTVFAGSTVWEAYNTAMENAAKAVYSTFRNGTFATLNTGKADLYKPAFENLSTAIEELDAQVLSAGVDSTIALLDKYFPQNEEGMEYDDPNFIHQGVADYVKYTYNNFRDEWRTAQGMIDSATIPDAEGNVAVVNELTKAYNEHRLTLYYNRLLTKDAYKTHLAEELASPSREIGDASEYSTESWANYQKALAFATATNNEANPVQTKINTAYRELLEAEKRLVAPTSGGGDVTEEPSFELVDPSGTAELVLIEGVEGKIITGIGNASVNYAPEDYFACTGCYVEVTNNAQDMFSTGAVVTIKNSATNEVIDTYTVAVFGDITGDGTTDSSELAGVLTFSGGSVTPSEVDILAADLTLDGAADSSDLSYFLSVAAASATINAITREVNLG